MAGTRSRDNISIRDLKKKINSLDSLQSLVFSTNKETAPRHTRTSMRKDEDAMSMRSLSPKTKTKSVKISKTKTGKTKKVKKESKSCCHKSASGHCRVSTRLIFAATTQTDERTKQLSDKSTTYKYKDMAFLLSSDDQIASIKKPSKARGVGTHYKSSSEGVGTQVVNIYKELNSMPQLMTALGGFPEEILNLVNMSEATKTNTKSTTKKSSKDIKKLADSYIIPIPGRGTIKLQISKQENNAEDTGELDEDRSSESVISISPQPTVAQPSSSKEKKRKLKSSPSKELYFNYLNAKLDKLLKKLDVKEPQTTPHSVYFVRPSEAPLVKSKECACLQTANTNAFFTGDKIPPSLQCKMQKVDFVDNLGNPCVLDTYRDIILPSDMGSPVADGYLNPTVGKVRSFASHSSMALVNPLYECNCNCHNHAVHMKRPQYFLQEALLKPPQNYKQMHNEKYKNSE